MSLEKVVMNMFESNNEIILFSKRIRHPLFNDEYIDIKIYYNYINISIKDEVYHYKNKINLENICFRLHDNIISINEYKLSLSKKNFNFYIILFSELESLMIVELYFNSKSKSLLLQKYNKFSLHHFIYKDKDKIENIYLHSTKYSFFLIFEKSDNNENNPEDLIIENNLYFFKYSFSYHSFDINNISISNIHNLDSYKKFIKIENDVYSNEFINQQFTF